jgi:hypothetical protein
LVVGHDPSIQKTEVMKPHTRYALLSAVLFVMAILLCVVLGLLLWPCGPSDVTHKWRYEFHDMLGNVDKIMDYNIQQTGSNVLSTLVRARSGQLLTWQLPDLLLAQECYSNGKLEGVAVYYRHPYVCTSRVDLGKLLRLDTFRNGKRHGETIIWHANGLKWEQGFYQNGLKGLTVKETIWKTGQETVPTAKSLEFY